VKEQGNFEIKCFSFSTAHDHLLYKIERHKNEYEWKITPGDTSEWIDNEGWVHFDGIGE